MSHVLHDIEKQIVKLLQSEPKLTQKQISQKTNLTLDQVRRGTEWLKLKKPPLAETTESTRITYGLGKNGKDARKNDLPERRLVTLVQGGPKTFDEIQSSLQGAEFNVAIAHAKKNDWINIEKTDTDSKISLKHKNIEKSEEETAIDLIGDATDAELPPGKYLKALDSLMHREEGFIERHVDKTVTVSLSEQGREIDLEKLDSGAIDVEADVPHVHAARIHPLKDTINEIRDTFVHLGFTEITGNLSQSSFWNFDALFTPQDHPARELQDTFYLKDLNAKQLATPTQIKNVSNAHKKGWRYYWDIQEARKMVLRTHTTCVTIKHLAIKFLLYSHQVS